MSTRCPLDTDPRFPTETSYPLYTWMFALLPGLQLPFSMEIDLGRLMQSTHLHTDYLGLPTYHQVVLHMPDGLSHRTVKDATHRYSDYNLPSF